jgi:hypothetical protein
MDVLTFSKIIATVYKKLRRTPGRNSAKYFFLLAYFVDGDVTPSLSLFLLFFTSK